jgi:hypothetical protein
LTCYVEGPTDRLEYIGSATVENDAYEIRFGLLNPVLLGEYRVSIKAEGMDEPRFITFIYDPSPGGPEPNDPDDHPNTSEEAALVYLAPNKVNRYSGAVDYKEDKDWFRISSAMAAEYSMLMVAPDSNVNVAVYDSNLNILTTDKSYKLALNASEEFYIEISYNENVKFRKASYNIYIGESATNVADGIEIDAVVGKTYNVSLNAKDVTDIGAKTYTITYDTGYLQLVSAAGQASAPQTSPGKIPGTDITILSHSDGVLVIEVSRAAADVYTGMVTVLQFEGVADGVTEILME